MLQTSLQLTGAVHLAKNADLLYDDLAHALMAAGLDAVRQRQVFHLALSGGSTPDRFYQRLVTDPRFRPIPWQDTHLWIVDERRVPDDHEECNFHMIRQTLVDHVPIRQRCVHPMPVLDEDPATRYEAELRRAFAGQTAAHDIPQLDFILLGMGDDAHTASLFPRSQAIDESKNLVAVNQGPHVTPPDRVTMTYPLLNAARQLVVLVTGQDKTDTLRRVDQQLRQSGPDPGLMPITGINPQAIPAGGGEGTSGGGQLTWYLDPQAAPPS